MFKIINLYIVLISVRCFLSSLQIFHFHIKSKERSQHRSIDSKGILKQNESEKAPNRQEETGSNSNQVSLAILQERVAIFFMAPKCS